ncbi:MAG: hypothetical protein WBA54_05225, partial [Acidaminobacteraceae bacterium]
MKIIIITTGSKIIKETGFGSVSACLAVKSALKKSYEDVTVNRCTSLKKLNKVIEQSPDLVVLASKYVQLKNGEKIWLSKFFEDANITYTGSKLQSLEYATNKIKAKELILQNNIKTAEYTIVTPENYLLESNITITYPLFVKPLDAANCNGIGDDSIVYNHKEFVVKAENLFEKYGGNLIAETYISGREFTVSVAHDFEKNEYNASPIEIIPPFNDDNIRILGEDVKKENSEELKVVADPILRKRLKELAIT